MFQTSFDRRMRAVVCHPLLWALCGLAALAAPAGAQGVPQGGAAAEAAASPPTVVEPAAPPAMDLLALQRSGTAAAPSAPPMPAAVATKVYRRYVDSFGHPLPEWHRSSVGGSRTGAGSSGR